MALRLSKNNVSLGRVRVYQPTTILVNIINDGDTPESLVISKFSCGACTTASLQSNVVPANGQVQMTVVFTPKSTSQVAVNKSVTINGNLIFTFNAIVIG